MARRNFKMLYVSRNRITVDQTRAYAEMSLDDLRKARDDLERVLKIKFTTEKYNQLGAVKTAILMRSPLCIQRPKPEIRKVVNNVTNWRPVKIRED